MLQALSTDQRRRLCRTSKRLNRLIAESWTHIDIALEGSNLVDSANLQLKWLLARDVSKLQELVSWAASACNGIGGSTCCQAAAAMLLALVSALLAAFPC